MILPSVRKQKEVNYYKNILLRFIKSASFSFKIWRVTFNTVSFAYARFLRELIHYLISYVIARFVLVSESREYFKHTQTLGLSFNELKTLNVHASCSCANRTRRV